jgi:hypothetical protein
MQKMMLAHECKQRILAKFPEAHSVHQSKNIWSEQGCYVNLYKPSWRNLWSPRRTTVWKEYADAWITLAYDLGLLEEDVHQEWTVLEAVGKLDTLILKEDVSD